MEKQPTISSDSGLPGLAYPKTRRLLTKTDFKRVLDGGLKVVCREMVVFALPQAGCARLGLIVSKKVGDAITRNRVKRRLREIFRLFPMADQAAWDIVIIARHEAARGDYHHLDAAFRQCYSRLQKNWQRRVSAAP